MSSPSFSPGSTTWSMLGPLCLAEFEHPVWSELDGRRKSPPKECFDGLDRWWGMLDDVRTLSVAAEGWDDRMKARLSSFSALR